MTAQDEPQTPPLPVPDGWEGILEPEERILWQGQPAAGLRWQDLLDKRTPFGLVFAGFAVFWMVQAASASGVFMALFGLPFLAVGLNMAIGGPLRDARRRSATFYSLTDRAAFVATRGTGARKLDRYPLGPGFRPTLEDGDPGSVWFATSQADARRGWRGTGSARSYDLVPVGQQRIGFEQISDARMVYGLMLANLRDQAGVAAAKG